MARMRNEDNLNRVLRPPIIRHIPVPTINIAGRLRASFVAGMIVGGLLSIATYLAAVMMS